MFCSKCGMQFSNGATFCSGCGNPAGTVVSQPYSPTLPSTNQNFQTQQFSSPQYGGSQMTSGLAVSGFILSLIGISVIGIILGHLGRKEIRESGGTKSGDGLATAAIVIGWIWLVISIVIGIVIGIAFANAGPSYY